MKYEISQKLRTQLADLSSDQLNNLITQAKNLARKSKERDVTFDTWVLRVQRKHQRMLDSAENVHKGTVASVFLTQVLIDTGSSTEFAKLPMNAVCVGDNVEVGTLGDDLVIVHVEPRTSWLSRSDVQSAHKEQLFASNLDAVVIVVSVGTPPLHPRLIDRFLIAAQNGKVPPVLVVNKIDLLEDPTELDVLDIHRQNGVPVYYCSTKLDQGMDALRDELKGKKVAFVGHSGVGKSSLANAYAPGLGLNTGGVSEGYGRGRHTTTVSSLHRLDDGTILIDTPGIRSFGLWAVTNAEIDAAFPEIAGLQCKFRDCSHTREPGCAVSAAIADGSLLQDRYDAYLRLKQEAG